MVGRGGVGLARGGVGSVAGASNWQPALRKNVGPGGGVGRQTARRPTRRRSRPPQGERGGALWADNATVSIRGGAITHNEAKSGGGVYARTPRADPALTALSLAGFARVEYNGAGGAGGEGGRGGGLFLQDTRTSVRSSYVRYNNAAADGAGIYAARSAGSGGAANAGRALLALSAAWVRGNKAGGRGGGVFLSDARAWASDSSLKENTAGAGGGGLYAEATVPDPDNYLRLSTTSLVRALRGAGAPGRGACGAASPWGGLGPGRVARGWPCATPCGCGVAAGWPAERWSRRLWPALIPPNQKRSRTTRRSTGPACTSTASAWCWAPPRCTTTWRRTAAAACTCPPISQTRRPPR
jgi:hypothetical protein